MTIYNTARICIREFREGDLEPLFRLMSDPEIMRYIRAPDTEIEMVRNRLVTWAAYHAEHPKLGVFALESIEDGAFAGYCVARHVGFEAGKDLEVGYAIAPELAGKGLATEVAQGLSDYLFDAFPVDKLVAFTDPRNVVSQRVLEKSGFQRTGVVTNVYDGESVVFERYR